MTVQLKVTPERFDEIFSVEEWFSMGELSNIQLYEKMLGFVVDDKGEYLSEAEARLAFKEVLKKDWNAYVIKFLEAINSAFVDPTKGGGSLTPVRAEPIAPPSG